jgi:hypothetical protein
MKAFYQAKNPVAPWQRANLELAPMSGADLSPAWHSFRRYSLRAFLLALCLLGSQWILTEHQSDLHVHSEDDVCFVCLAWQTPEDVVPSASQLAISYGLIPTTSREVASLMIGFAPAGLVARSPPLSLS